MLLAAASDPPRHELATAILADHAAQAPDHEYLEAIAALLKANELPSSALGNRRWINVPGISVTVGEMADSLERVAGSEVARRIRWQREERIERMVLGWPAAIDNSRAVSLGFSVDQNVDSIVRGYVEQDLNTTVSPR